MAFLQSAFFLKIFFLFFFTIAKAERRQLDSSTLGPLELSITVQRKRWGKTTWTETANSKMLTVSFSCLTRTHTQTHLLPLQNETPRVGITVWSYGMYPKSGFDDWRPKLSLSPPHLILSPSPSFPCGRFPCCGFVISDQRPVGSKDVDLESREMESNGWRK